MAGAPVARTVVVASRGLVASRPLRGTVGSPVVTPPDPEPEEPPLPNAPVISSIVESDITTTTATISWSVDQPSQGEIRYGTADGGPYGSTTTRETSYDYTDHGQVITGLTPNTTYYYKIWAMNAADQETLSGQGSFTTDAEPPAVDDFDTGYTYTDHTVPTGTGWTDGTDCRTALQSFFTAVPSGSSSTNHRRIIFPAGFTWRISGNIVISGKSHWTIEGMGTETTYGHTGGAIILRSGGLAKSDTASGHFSASHTTSTAGFRATDIRFHCLTLRGDSTIHSTTATYTAAYAMGISFRSCDGGRVSHCIIERVRGDHIYIASAQTSAPFTPSRNILIDGNLLQDNERMGVATVDHDSTLTIRDNKFSDIMYAAFDAEPNTSAAKIGNIVITGNLFDDTMSWGSDYNDGILKADAQHTTVPDHYGTLLIEDNHFSCTVLNNAGQGWMFAGTFGNGYIKSGLLTIRNNTCDTPSAGPVVRGARWAGGITMLNNTGFKTASGSWFMDSGGNGTITQSGNT